MEKNRNLLDLITKSDLTTISNKMFSYLSSLEDNGKINIKRDFSFVGFKEIVRTDLLVYQKIYELLSNSHDEETISILQMKSNTKNYVDQILNNEETLNYFTIYKIQQFIDSIILEISPTTTYFDRQSYILRPNMINLREKESKYLKYKGKIIDMTGYNGYPKPDEISEYFYSSFGLEHIPLEKYIGTLKLKWNAIIVRNTEYVDELNKYLFKAGVDLTSSNSYVYSHPFISDEKIFDFVSNGEVATRKKKKSLKKTGESCGKF